MGDNPHKPLLSGNRVARCGDTGLAEDLTAESFLAAVHAVRKPGAPDPSIPWLIGVARHKLADHWRRAEREQRGLRLLDDDPARVRLPLTAACWTARVEGPFGPAISASIRAVACSISLACAS